MLLQQLKIELLVYLRQPLYLLFSVIMPVVVFAVFASMFGESAYGDASFFAQYIPAFVTLIVFASAVYNIGNQVVTDKVRGVYRRLLVTPMPFGRFLFVLVLKASLTALAGLALVLIAARVMFEVTSPHLVFFVVAFVVALVYALTFGFGAGVVFTRINTYSAVMMFAFLPMFFLSDAAWPIAMLPEWLQTVAEYNPLYHLVKLMRWAWDPSVEVWQSNSLWISVAVLLALMLVFLPVVLWRWRKTNR